MIPQFYLPSGIISLVVIFSISYFSPISGNGYTSSEPKARSSTCSSREVYTPSDDEYLFSLLNTEPNRPLNLWDGPSSLSSAPTTISNTQFTEEELKYYNWFTAAMYCPYSLSDLSCCHCRHFNDSVTSIAIWTNKQYGTKAMVTLHPSKSEIVLTLRGSVVILNWIMDFYLLPVRSGTGVKIHRGFYLSTMSIYNKVVQEIGRLLRDNASYRVVLTGHSLGGSMASLFTYFLTSLNQFPGTNYALVTYGQMRTGNKAYVNYMNSLQIPTTRVVARADIIPHIIAVSGFSTLFGVYYLHHGQEVWINGNITKYCSSDKYEDPNCSNRMGPKYTLLDHVQYFSTDYTVCYLSEGWLDVDLLGLPIGWTPTTYLPPMPEVLQEVVDGVVEGGYQGILPPT